VVARVTAVLRRLKPSRSSEETSGIPRLRLSHDKRRVSIGDQAIELTRVEFDLLGLLHSDPGHVFSRAVIIDRVWGEGFALSDRTIDSHIKALRKKLGDCGGSGEWIETVRGIGYRLAEEGPSP
jgi:two-component system catabolic regulation response regulator CreB